MCVHKKIYLQTNTTFNIRTIKVFAFFKSLWPLRLIAERLPFAKETQYIKGFLLTFKGQNNV